MFLRSCTRCFIHFEESWCPLSSLFRRTFGPKQSRAVLRELFVHFLELFGYALAADRRSRADTRLQQSWDQGCQLML